MDGTECLWHPGITGTPGNGPAFIGPQEEQTDQRRVLRMSSFPAEPAPDERSFRFSTTFYMVLAFDLLVSVWLAGSLFQAMLISPEPFRSDKLPWYVVMLASFGNIFLDLALLYRIRIYPVTINRVLCWCKVLTGMLGILTIIPGIYFFIISARMINAPAVVPVRSPPGRPGPVIPHESLRYHAAELLVVLLVVAGLGIVLLGFGIAGGNRTGISPTFPFAGYLTSAAGAGIAGLGIHLERTWLRRLKS